MIFKAILDSNDKKRELLLDPEIVKIDDSTDGITDEKGRTIRWQRILQQPDPNQRQSRWCNRDRALNEIEVEATISQINEEIYEKIEER